MADGPNAGGGGDRADGAQTALRANGAVRSRGPTMTDVGKPHHLHLAAGLTELLHVSLGHVGTDDLVNGALGQKDRNARWQHIGRVLLQKRVPGLDVRRSLDRQEVLLERLFGPLPLDQIERTLDAFACQAIDHRHRTWVD